MSSSSSSSSYSASRGPKPLPPHLRPTPAHHPQTAASSSTAVSPPRGIAYVPPGSLPYAPRPSTSPARSTGSISGPSDSRHMQKSSRGLRTHSSSRLSSSSHTSHTSYTSSPTTSIRPLPRVPSYSSAMSSSYAFSPTPSFTRPLPHPPMTPALPSSPVPEPRIDRSGSLKLIVNTKLSVRDSFQSDTSVSTPLWAGPPSPTTAKRKQHSKLRRHLGESIPADLIYGSKSSITPSKDDTRALEDVPEEYTFWKVDFLEGIARDSDEEGSSEDGLGRTLEMRWDSLAGPPPKRYASTRDAKLFGGKWCNESSVATIEKSGKRWIAFNDDVIHALRKL